jgi:UDP-N-acetylmuramate--alanine ligase
LDDFAISFADSDLVVLTDIYSAGEPNLEQIKGEDVVQSIRSHHSAVHYHQDIKSLPNFLHKILSPGDLVLFLGAGNLNQVIPQLIDFYTI